MILLYVPIPTQEVGKTIARVLLEKHLIACANILGPIESMYHWKGKIADEKEFVLIAKTINKNYNKVVRETEKIHSYTVPCIVKIPVSSNKKYFDWIIGELN